MIQDDFFTKEYFNILLKNNLHIDSYDTESLGAQITSIVF